MGNWSHTQQTTDFRIRYRSIGEIVNEQNKIPVKEDQKMSHLTKKL